MLIILCMPDVFIFSGYLGTLVTPGLIQLVCLDCVLDSFKFNYKPRKLWYNVINFSP
jgi:hypothetical protein